MFNECRKCMYKMGESMINCCFKFKMLLWLYWDILKQNKEIIIIRNGKKVSQTCDYVE